MNKPNDYQTNTVDGAEAYERGRSDDFDESDFYMNGMMIAVMMNMRRKNAAVQIQVVHVKELKKDFYESKTIANCNCIFF